MISSIEVRNFQSLSHVAVELAPFTVIVGPSDSGKSAFTRAVRTLTSNQRGNAFISHGEKVTTIKATTDRGVVMLQRGKAASENKYVVIPEGDVAQQTEYTKLNGDTPPEVSQFIGIAAKDPINYAGQFDKPYLLDDSGGEVARVLGALTNVSVIFEAARESNRRKLAASSTLKTRANDIEVIRNKISDYRPLKQQRAAVEQAEGHIEKARELKRQIERLRQLITVITQARQIITTYGPLAEAEIPTTEGIEKAHKRVQQLTQTIADIREAASSKRAAEATVAESNASMVTLHERYIDILTEAGTCPTCGQDTHDKGALTVHA